MWGKVSCLRKHWDVETRGAYHLAKISENSGLNVNGKAIFWKFQSKNSGLPSKVFFFLWLE